LARRVREAPLRTGARAASPVQAAPRAEAAAGKPGRLVLEGYVKGGVVHLLEGELPEGIFVKVVRE
jgi:ribonuclease HI